LTTTSILHSNLRHLQWLLFLSLLFIPSILHAQVKTPRQLISPNPDEGAETLAARAQAQGKTLSLFKVFHQFHFTDRLKESGITFRHHPAASALQNFAPTHYDHGNAVAVADVDGDGLYDILFINQLGGNELWRNTGAGKFKNITAEAGIALPGKVSIGAAFADIDNDGDQDLLITTVRGGDHLFRNEGRGRFSDITEDAGINVVAHSVGAAFFDYDRDGLVDLVICNVGRFTSDKRWPDGTYVGLNDAFSGHLFPDRYEHSVLYKNMGRDKFKDVTAELGLRAEMWNGDVNFADVNNDGWPDLYFTNMQGDDHYFENQGGKRFMDKTAQYFPATPWGSMGVKFFDYDNDGRMDLFVTDMHSDMTEDIGIEKEKLKAAMHMEDEFLMTEGKSIFGNALYHQLENGKFEEVSDRLGAETYWPWGISVADVNADGWDDAFVTGGMGFPFRYGINSMLLNNRGEKFLDSEFILGIEPRRDGRTHAFSFDLDCSSPPEGVVGKLCLKQSGTLRIMGALSSRSSAVFDMDNDGDLDIVTNDFNSEPMVLMSDLAAKSSIHWLKIVLQGSKANRNGLGAVVRLSAGKQMYMRYNDGKSGYLAQSVLPMYFGLGEAATINRIEVDWPSGRKQVLTKRLAANQTLLIAEPE
jgi:hypothetical protein